MLNTKVSDGFIIASSNLSTQLIAQISNGTQSTQTPGDYFKSEMEKQPDTYDTENFCDYILSQNAYETSDGSTIKLPNIYDYVYEVMMEDLCWKYGRSAGRLNKTVCKIRFDEICSG